MQGTSTTEAKPIVSMCHINHLNNPPCSTPSQFFGHLWPLFRESDLVPRVSPHDIVEPATVPNHNSHSQLQWLSQACSILFWPNSGLSRNFNLNWQTLHLPLQCLLTPCLILPFSFLWHILWLTCATVCVVFVH